MGFLFTYVWSTNAFVYNAQVLVFRKHLAGALPQSWTNKKTLKLPLEVAVKISWIIVEIMIELLVISMFNSERCEVWVKFLLMQYVNSFVIAICYYQLVNKSNIKELSFQIFNYK